MARIVRIGSDDVFVRIVRLPDGIRGFCMKGSDGYSVYLDDRLDQDHMRKTLAHELHHIKSGDFDKEDVQEIEATAHAAV